MLSHKLVVATKPLSRNIHRSQLLLNTTDKLQNIKKWQEHFQKPDGVPVYLKRGLTDRLLVGFITIGTFLGLGNSFQFLYEEALKP